MEISWIAVIVAAVVKFAIGAVWFTALFGKEWRRLQGVPEAADMSGLGAAMAVQIVTDLIMAYVLARFIVHYSPPSLGEGLLIGLMAWIGFVATISLGQVFYEKRSWALWAIGNGYQLVGLLVMGAILGWWQSGAAAVGASVQVQ